MGTTLSPFRYIQLARYVVHKCMDSIPTIKVNGQARARYLQHTPPHREHIVRNGVAHQAPERQEAGPSSVGQMSGGSGHKPDPDTEEPHDRNQKHLKRHKHPRPFPTLAPDPKWPTGPKEIYTLMNDQRLSTHGAVKPPREVVVLCHGLYGFSTATPIPLFPSLKLHYWASVLEVLRDRIGAKVVVVGVKGTGSVQERAEQMHEFLKNTLPKGTGVNFVAHSMGGLDCRHLISVIKPTTYTALSLTTIGTPHRGSPFMDWCATNIGVGSAAAVASALTSEKFKNLPYSLKSPLLSRPSAKAPKADTIASLATGLTSYLLSIFDSPAYSNLTTAFLRDHFNPATPDDPSVKYISVAGRISKMSVLHPLWFPKLVLDAAAENGYAEDSSNMIVGADGKPRYEGNDGLVSVSSAKWGEYLGAVDECHHWDLRGEGGLFPTNASLTIGPHEGELGFDWEKKKDDSGKNVNEELGLAGSEQEKELMRIHNSKEKEAGNAGAPPKSGEPTSESSAIFSPSTWDIAQVGQVVDWVTDYIPGGTSSEAGKRQMEDAKQEKQKELAVEKEVEKKKRDKFDLERFYSALVVKLRDDGY